EKELLCWSGRLIATCCSAAPASPREYRSHWTTTPHSRYAGFRAVADERNGSPTALMQSLKHYKVLHVHDVIRRALWLTISCGADSASVEERSCGERP